MVAVRHVQTGSVPDLLCQCLGKNDSMSCFLHKICRFELCVLRNAAVRKTPLLNLKQITSYFLHKHGFLESDQLFKVFQTGIQLSLEMSLNVLTFLPTVEFFWDTVARRWLFKAIRDSCGCDLALCK